MDNVTYSLKAHSLYRQIRSKLLNISEESTTIPIGSYVRIYFYFACAVVAFLGFIAMFTDSFWKGAACILVAIIIAAIESIFLVPVIEKISFVQLFLANYVWRIIVYVILSIFTFISWATFIGGILILIGCLGYGFCIYKGEKPVIQTDSKKGLDLEEDFETSAFDQSSKGDGLLSDYQNV